MVARPVASRGKPCSPPRALTPPQADDLDSDNFTLYTKTQEPIAQVWRCSCSPPCPMTPPPTRCSPRRSAWTVAPRRACRPQRHSAAAEVRGTGCHRLDGARGFGIAIAAATERDMREALEEPDVSGLFFRPPHVYFLWMVLARKRCNFVGLKKRIVLYSNLFG